MPFWIIATVCASVIYSNIKEACGGGGESF